MTSGVENILAHQKEKVYLDFARLIAVVVIAGGKVMLLFGRGFTETSAQLEMLKSVFLWPCAC